MGAYIDVHMQFFYHFQQLTVCDSKSTCKPECEDC